MDKITIKNKIIILVFGIVLGAGAILGGFTLSHKSSSKDLKQEQAALKTTQGKLEQAEQKVTELKNTVDEKEKALKENGPNSYKDLQNTALKFFEIYYNYNQEKVTNKERQEQVQGLSTQSVYDKMFPLSADEMKSDYGYVQSSLNNLQVYPTGLNGNDITALVDASYNVKAGEMDSTVQHYMWKVTFDSNTNQINNIEDMGKLSTSGKNE
ncbi:hypothetical protein LMK05_07120 [Lactococcus petauri]|nr:hypothetical protein LMK05_07120 [Lactococcus petauri]